MYQRLSFDLTLGFILLLMNGLCNGRDGYMTILNYTPSNAAANDIGFICYPPQLISGDSLSYGRMYAINNDDSTAEKIFSIISWKTAYKTAGPAIDGSIAGVYYCKLHQDGMTTIVETSKIVSDAWVTPLNDKTSISVNVGDSVTISFVVTEEVIMPYVWRKAGVTLTTSNTTSLTLHLVSVADAGMYEMHGSGQRTLLKHSFINLIVRACPRHKWGPPNCVDDCNYCYNGGICDDKTGHCICGPGFMGSSCKTNCNGDKHGWNCGAQCSRSSNSFYRCRSFQFCLSYPYGCSCFLGFKGGDCLTACSSGMYGAGCTQLCQCDSGTCNKYTGICTGDDKSCKPRWKGSNCQECEDNYYGDNCDVVCPKPCSCSRIAGMCLNCNRGWLEPECETGIANISFTPTNNGQMTDVLCNVSIRDTSDIQATVQLDTNGVVDIVTHLSVEENQGIASYRFALISNIETRYFCVIKQSNKRADKEIDVVIYKQPLYSGVLQVNETNGSMVKIFWTKWENNTASGDGPINGYILHYKKTNEEQMSNWENASLINGLSGIVSNLQWETNYTFAVSAVREGEGGQGPIGEKRVVTKTLCGEPNSIENASLNIDQNYIIFTWSEIETTIDVMKCSNLTYYVYTVYLMLSDRVNELYRGRNISFEFEYMEEYIGNTIYVTVSNKDSESAFVKVTIPKLEGVEPTENVANKRTSSAPIGGVIGGVVCVCILLGLLCLFLIRRRRRTVFKKHETSSTKMEIISAVDNVEDSPSAHNSLTEHFPATVYDDNFKAYENVQTAKRINFSRRVDVSKLAQYVAKNKAVGLENDFHLLPKDQLHPWDYAGQSCHVTRNRFKNIIPYDNSRVVLDSSDGTDYYNASYINGYIESNYYIASQGPNKGSLIDFWRMIWQKEISIIVMLTNIIETKKKKVPTATLR